MHLFTTGVRGSSSLIGISEVSSSSWVVAAAERQHFNRAHHGVDCLGVRSILDMSLAPLDLTWRRGVAKQELKRKKTESCRAHFHIEPKWLSHTDSYVIVCPTGCHKTMMKIHHHRIHQIQTASCLLLSTNAFTLPNLRPILSPQSSSTRLMSSLVSIPQAIAASNDDGSIFIDGSWYMPNTRNAREEFRKGPRISGARYFDIDTVWWVLYVGVYILITWRHMWMCTCYERVMLM